jgi:SAM-dependent methyltransferase
MNPVEDNRLDVPKMRFSGERIIPGEVPRDMELMHRKLYEFALQYVEGKRVLDVGCGEGYGSAMLARKAMSVVGVDISEEAIAHAAAKYSLDNVEFRCMPVEHLSFPGDSFDVLVCLEVIEHARGYIAALEEMRRVLRPEGTLVLSTPNKNVTSPRRARPLNIYHLHEFTIREARKLFRRYFSEVEFFSQDDPFAGSRKIVWKVMALDFACLRKLFPRSAKDRMKWRIRESLGETIGETPHSGRWSVVPRIGWYSRTIVAVCRRKK